MDGPTSPPDDAYDPAAWPRVDLHSHTTLSDGSLTPRALVRRAAGVGLEVLAVTDHDTTEALAEALDEAGQVGLRVIAGMEVSARTAAGRSVHVLAFFPGTDLAPLAAWQGERRALRRARLERMLERLAALGLPVPLESVVAGADPRRSPGRLHVAQALVRAGHVATTQEAFDRYLGEGKPGYVEDEVPRAAAAIAMIHTLGGLSVVAHPALDGLDQDLEALQADGLDGVEAFHAGHAPEVARRLHARARDLGLLVTGGSDFHGDQPVADPTAGAPSRLGRVTLPHDEWARFDAALRARAPGDQRTP
jgi:predicted metal-dependent phosphoesterase TrpH